MEWKNVILADGYVNSRVVHFTMDGKYLGQWGKKGGDGEFNLVHDIVFDKRNRLLVGERTNQRIQIFDLAGKFLGKWIDIGAPWALTYADREGAVYMADGVNMRVVKLGTWWEFSAVRAKLGDNSTSRTESRWTGPAPCTLPRSRSSTSGNS
jgi:hypothetical protein